MTDETDMTMGSHTLANQIRAIMTDGAPRDRADILNHQDMPSGMYELPQISKALYALEQSGCIERVGLESDKPRKYKATGKLRIEETKAALNYSPRKAFVRPQAALAPPATTEAQDLRLRALDELKQATPTITSSDARYLRVLSDFMATRSQTVANDLSELADRIEAHAKQAA